MAEAPLPSTQSKVSPGLGLGALEKAWDLHWGMRFVCMVLFFDIALLLRSKTSLIEWSADSDTLLANLGFLAVAVASFALVVSFVLPLIAVVIRWLGFSVPMALPRIFQGTREQHHRPLGWVPAKALHHLALEEKDPFLMGIYQQSTRQREEYDQMIHNVAQLVLGCLLLALADWALSHYGFADTSLIHSAVMGLGKLDSVVVPIVLIAGCALLKWAWFTDHPPHWIEYPPLDRVLRAKERKDDPCR